MTTCPRGLRIAFALESQHATIADVVRGWRDAPAFRSLFDATLAAAPFAAIRWECPPVTTASASRPFECVVLDSPELDDGPDPAPFADSFRRSTGDVVVMPNLGGDAILVVPRPIAEPAAYPHLAAFVRRAPAAQRDALWQSVGEAMARRIGAAPVWLSTAGAGAAWLHVWLDDRPKYYRFAPYRRSA